jgi:putative transcriptional regulator
MGMSLQNIQRIEYGDAKSIPLETLDKLCEILDCQPGDLLIRVPDGEPQDQFPASPHWVQGLNPKISLAAEDNSEQDKLIYSVSSHLSPALESA